MLRHIYLIVLLLFPGAFCPIAYAETAASEASATQKAELTISEEAIASLSGQLSDEQFSVVKDKIVGQIFAELDLSVLTPQAPATASPQANEQQDEQEQALEFDDEDLEKIRLSLNLYFDTLNKIKQIAPLLQTMHEHKVEIKKRKKSLDSLMKEEQTAVQKEIEDLKAQLEAHTASFKNVAHQFNLQNINFDKLPGMLNDLGYSADFYDIAYTELSEYISLIKKVSTASAIMDSLAEVSTAIEEAQAALRMAQTEEEKAAVAENLKKLIDSQKMLYADFTLTATGIDPASLEEKSGRKVNVEEELTKVFSPLITGLTEFTEPSRQIEFLRSNIAYYQQHLPKIREGLAQIERLLQETTNTQVKAKLLAEQEHWQQQEKEFSAKLAVAEQQLIDLQNKKLSPTEAVEQFAEAVFSKRGLNIMFAVMMFFVSFIVLLLLRRLILLINPFSYIPRLRFIASLIDVVLYLLTFVVATLTLMVTLYIAGEILALAFVVIVLMGIIWALKETLPMFVEQIKLLLGYGPVRQGERVLYAGIPWQVESIGIYSYLSNALLTGGKVRLPIRDLIDMRSRPYDKNERWFPCQEGDYILINHTKWRKVIQQTAESIKFEWFGMEETMPTAQFLAQKIFNLSNTSFWVGINLHIAYEHRLEIMPDIISQFTELLETEFKQLPYGNSLLQPWIAFAGMNDTSLSLMAWVQLKSEAAAYYEDAKLDLTKISLQAANHYAWEIKRFHTIQQRDTQPDISIQSPLPLGAEG